MMAMLKSIPRQRLILLSACLVGLIVLMGLIWRNASVEPVSRLPGGAFHLVDQTGKPVSENILKGKWSAVFFGFTYCPDVCPTTLQVLAQAQDQLGPRAKDFQVVFVSVDPGRDTPEQLANYLSNSAFPKATLGLTGTPAQIAQIARIRDWFSRLQRVEVYQGYFDAHEGLRALPFAVGYAGAAPGSGGASPAG